MRDIHDALVALLVEGAGYCVSIVWGRRVSYVRESREHWRGTVSRDDFPSVLLLQCSERDRPEPGAGHQNWSTRLSTSIATSYDAPQWICRMETAHLVKGDVMLCSKVYVQLKFPLPWISLSIPRTQPERRRVSFSEIILTS